MSPLGSQFVAPTVDWLAVGPVLSVLVVAVIGVLVEAFFPRTPGRRWVHLVLAMVGLFLAVAMLTVLWVQPYRFAISYGEGMPGGMLLDKVSVFLQGLIAVMGAFSLLILFERADGSLESIAAQPAAAPGSGQERAAQEKGWQATEIFPLTMFAIGGMMIFASAVDLLTMFVALEVFSLPLYILCGLARHRRLLSLEASLKYFLLGAFSSALFLFGVALVYGFTGTINILAFGSGMYRNFADGAGIPWTSELALLIVAILLILVGFLFKVGAVPFHSWTPDVYTGAPTPVTGFMAACTKAAAFGALLRVMLVPVQVERGIPGFMWPAKDALLPGLVVVAVLSMVVGSVVAIRQQDIKRMLAYSAIAHTGFILTGLASFSAQAVPGTLFYLLAYGIGSIAAFGIVTLIRERSPDGSVGPEATNLTQWDGLGRRSPWLAAGFTILLFSMAGIPLTAGFIAKFGAFSAAVSTGKTTLVALAVIGVICSAIAASFYLRVVVRMFFTDSDAAARSTVVVAGPWTTAAVSACVAITVLLGVLPSTVLDWAGAILAAP